MLTEQMLRTLWPHGDMKVPGLIAGIASAAPRVFAKYGFTSDVEIAQAMAQFSHECGAGLEMTESIRYTAQRAAEVWPLHSTDDQEKAKRHFSDADDCYKKCGSWAGDVDFPGKLIDLVYGTRMGNRPGTHDGRNYIGRGLSQVTGREGYQKLGDLLAVDLLTNPSWVTVPINALEAGVADFVLCNCLPFAKDDLIVDVTKRLNGGTVGLDERKAWLVKWKKALAGSPPVVAIQPESAPAQKPVAKHVAAGAVVVAGGAAAKQAHSAGFSVIAIVAIVIATVAVAALVWYVFHRNSK